MKVLHVISSLDPRDGGPPVALAGLAEAQQRIGFQVSILATWRGRFNPALAARLQEHRIPLSLVGPGLGPLSWHWQIRSRARMHISQADVVHVHGVWEEVQHRAVRCAHRQQKPCIIRPCGMLDPWSLTQGRLKKRLYLAWRLRRDLDTAAALHFTSEIEREQTRELRLKAPAIVEPNGIDLAEFAVLPPWGTFRSRHPEIGSRPLVLFLGRLHPKKGLEVLIPAFAKTQAGNAVLAIAGPDANGYQPRLEALGRQCRLENRVLFTGMLEGAARVAALADADLFVLPSYQENFGIAVVEALAAGTPVIVSDQVNIHPAISSAAVGDVVPIQVEALASTLTRWLNHEGLRRAAAERARPFVWEQYDWERIAVRWTGHYRRLLTSGSLTTR